MASCADIAVLHCGGAVLDRGAVAWLSVLLPTYAARQPVATDSHPAAVCGGAPWQHSSPRQPQCCLQSAGHCRDAPPRGYAVVVLEVVSLCAVGCCVGTVCVCWGFVVGVWDSTTCVEACIPGGVHAHARTHTHTHAYDAHTKHNTAHGTAEALRCVVVRRLLWQLPKQIGSVPLGVLLSKHFDLVVDTGASVLLQELAALPSSAFTDRWHGVGQHVVRCVACDTNLHARHMWQHSMVVATSTMLLFAVCLRVFTAHHVPPQHAEQGRSPIAPGSVSGVGRFAPPGPAVHHGTHQRRLCSGLEPPAVECIRAKDDYWGFGSGPHPPGQRGGCGVAGEYGLLHSTRC